MDPDDSYFMPAVPPIMGEFERYLDPPPGEEPPPEEPDVVPLEPVTRHLAVVVAQNIRYEAARYELTQQDLADAVHKSRAAISLRYTGRVAWTLNEVGMVAELMGVRPAELVIRSRRRRPGL